jgi:Protein of unknown function (DUF1573)
MCDPRLDQLLPERTKPRWTSWFFALIVFLTINVILLVGFARIRFGSLGTALKYARGEVLIADSATKSFGVGNLPKSVEVPFLLTNYGSEPVRLLGFKATCNCTTPDSLPLVIKSNESKRFNIHVRTVVLPDRRPYTVKVTLFTSAPSQRETRLRITGMLVKETNSPRAGSKQVSSTASR